jgi:hypothetical protein
MSLWNQMGSRVILGNLLVIPIENSLLYVEPLYLRAENGQLPELQRVIASYSDRVVMGDNLDLTLAALFRPGALPAPQVITSNVPPPAKPAPGQVAPAGGPPVAGDLRAAAGHYDRALKALRVGDWSGFGTEMQQLGEALQGRAGP